MAWGTSPALYLSYGMVSLKGQRPALTDAVAAAQSFTALSPPMGLDYFAVFDGGHHGAPVAERLRARLAAAIAGQIDGELLSETPRFDHKLYVRAQVNRADEKQSAENAGGRLVDATPSELDNVLQATRASGSSSSKPLVVIPEPDVVVVERNARDDFLILASDGLWDAVTPALACALVRQRLVKTPRIARPREPPRLDARGSPTVLAKELAEQAVRVGSQDNVSVVLVLFRDFWARTPWQGN
ncbi:hypothetical protein BAE44_0008399 [Dichanthelium oligosanthes]|uniref:protein-serine/threonine phosphatase n=1 Tax=Dichanthelium oligosanthes TaxID=888268 RepID=A0A1E5VZQ9_9POAL|nr:hypothetical protein BAE44_0008399 [Dichanthelium oligosanthes]